VAYAKRGGRQRGATAADGATGHEEAVHQRLATARLLVALQSWKEFRLESGRLTPDLLQKALGGERSAVKVSV